MGHPETSGLWSLITLQQAESAAPFETRAPCRRRRVQTEERPVRVACAHAIAAFFFPSSLKRGTVDQGLPKRSRLDISSF